MNNRTKEQNSVSVTLTAKEFQQLTAEKEKLTDQLRDADALNSGYVSKIMDQEHSIAVLAHRINRLRKGIEEAYDVLARALSEDCNE
jgi:hypothetical protein